MEKMKKVKLDSFLSKHYFGELIEAEIGYNNGWSDCAKWKDNQFKEYLEKKRNYYFQKIKGNDIETLNKIQCLNEIINELFEKSEELSTEDMEE